MKKTTPKSRKRSLTPPVFETGSDLKTALLIISLLGNVVVLCIWIVLQLTSEYDQALINFFINR